MPATENQIGFTLIELSLVLVIIGLLVSGVLVGRDLIKSAEIRAQISQFEKYSTAFNTFRLKYNEIAGDISAAQVSAFGFTGVPNRVGTQAQGDGNGILEGMTDVGVLRYSQHGEPVWVWVDLSTNSGLIEGGFATATATPTVPDNIYYANGTPSLSKILPSAKIGKSNFITAYSAGVGEHYLIISYFDYLTGNGSPRTTSNNNLALTPLEAYAIDSKIDDGLPQTGRIKAKYVNYDVQYNAMAWAAGGGLIGASSTAATPASTTTCYDNGNVNGATQQYSISTNNGQGMNCALSVRLQ